MDKNNYFTLLRIRFYSEDYEKWMENILNIIKYKLIFIFKYSLIFIFSIL